MFAILHSPITPSWASLNLFSKHVTRHVVTSSVIIWIKSCSPKSKQVNTEMPPSCPSLDQSTQECCQTIQVKCQPCKLCTGFRTMDLEGSIRQIADFLDKPLSNLDVKKIAYHCQFENMKKNDSTNFSWGTKLGILDLTESQFMRKGEVGDWRSHFNQDTNEQINKMISFRFHNSGLHFDYDIKDPVLDSSPSEVRTIV